MDLLDKLGTVSTNVSVFGLMTGNQSKKDKVLYKIVWTLPQDNGSSFGNTTFYQERYKLFADKSKAVEFQQVVTQAFSILGLMRAATLTEEWYEV